MRGWRGAEVSGFLCVVAYLVRATVHIQLTVAYTRHYSGHPKSNLISLLFHDISRQGCTNFLGGQDLQKGQQWMISFYIMYGTIQPKSRFNTTIIETIVPLLLQG